MLLVITSTGDVFSVVSISMTLNDLKPSPHIKTFSDFCDFWLQMSELRRNEWR